MGKDILDLNEEQLNQLLDEIELTKEFLKNIDVKAFSKKFSPSYTLNWAKKLSKDRYFADANDYLEELLHYDEVKKEAAYHLMNNYKELHDSLKNIAFMLNPNPIPELEKKYNYFKSLYNQL